MKNRQRQTHITVCCLPFPGGDTLTDRQTVNRFMEQFPCSLTVVEDGEHWFHTPEQLGVLENWIRNETEHKDGE